MSVFVKFQAYNDWRVSVGQDLYEGSLSILNCLSQSEYTGKTVWHTLSKSLGKIL